MSDSGNFFGKYRGMVLNNIDPMQMGRLQVQVPDVAGLIPTTWAMPCVPLAGINMGMFALPMIGSGVWVEFEQGNPDYPIWVGCFWGSAAELPVLSRMVPPAVPGITLQTPLKNGLVISDVPGVRGAGIAYDGLYFVKSVTSTLKRGEFKQSFNLTRNGLVSITPRVPV